MTVSVYTNWSKASSVKLEYNLHVMYDVDRIFCISMWARAETVSELSSVTAY